MKFHAFLATLGFTTIPFAVQAATIYVDFNTTHAPSTTAHWNPYSLTANIPISLNNSDNTPTVYTLSLSGTIQPYSDTAPSNPSLPYPDGATRDGMYQNAQRTFTLSGLNPSLTYTLTLYGYANRGTSRETLVTIIGGDSDTYEPSGGGNTGGHVTFSDISPTSGGEIVFTVEPGPNADPANKNFILSALQIDYTIPEPATALLSAFGLIPLLRRRR